MNILVTSRCNRRCPYCFAAGRISYGQDGREASPAPEAISDEDFDRAIDFARASRLQMVGILGGDPSLHPRFPDLLERAWRAGLTTKVFTNGLWRERDLEEVRTRAERFPGRLGLVVNTNEPGVSPPAEQVAQERLFRAMGAACTLSFNLWRARSDMRFLVDLILAHGLRRHVRLGVAQPLADGKSACIPVSEYRAAAPAVLDLVDRCDEHDIAVGFDCGFTLCMFDDAQLGRLLRKGCGFRASCGPAVDVGTDLSVWACFPLATLGPGERLGDFPDHDALVAHFGRRFDRLYRTGALPECVDCRHIRRRQCSGGCAAHVYRSVSP